MKKPDSYNRQYIQADSCIDQEFWGPANTLSGLDWNYFIAHYIDRDLHEKLLAVTVDEITPIIDKLVGVLPLIRSGYFYTASVLVQQIDVSSSTKLTEIKTWLLTTLTDADDT